MDVFAHFTTAAPTPAFTPGPHPLRPPVAAAHPLLDHGTAGCRHCGACQHCAPCACCGHCRVCGRAIPHWNGGWWGWPYWNVPNITYTLPATIMTANTTSVAGNLLSGAATGLDGAFVLNPSFE